HRRRGGRAGPAAHHQDPGEARAHARDAHPHAARLQPRAEPRRQVGRLLDREAGVRREGIVERPLARPRRGRRGAAAAHVLEVREYTGFPIRNWDRWLDDSQIHLFVQALAEETAAHDLLAETKLVREPGFAGRFVEGSRDELDAAWAPDGQSIVFAVSTNRNV